VRGCSDLLMLQYVVAEAVLTLSLLYIQRGWKLKIWFETVSFGIWHFTAAFSQKISTNTVLTGGIKGCIYNSTNKKHFFTGGFTGRLLFFWGDWTSGFHVNKIYAPSASGKVLLTLRYTESFATWGLSTIPISMRTVFVKRRDTYPKCTCINNALAT